MKSCRQGDRRHRTKSSSKFSMDTYTKGIQGINQINGLHCFITYFGNTSDRQGKHSANAAQVTELWAVKVTSWLEYGLPAGL